MIESKINLHLVPSCVSDTRWSHRSSNLTLTLHGGSSLKIRPELRIFCRRGYLLCISISRSFSCWRRLHRTNVEHSLGMRHSTHYLLVNLRCCSPSIFFLSLPLIQLWVKGARNNVAKGDMMISGCGTIQSSCYCEFDHRPDIRSMTGSQVLWLASAVSFRLTVSKYTWLTHCIHHKKHGRHHALGRVLPSIIKSFSPLPWVLIYSIQIDSEYKHSTCFIASTAMNNFSC